MLSFDKLRINQAQNDKEGVANAIAIMQKTTKRQHGLLKKFERIVKSKYTMMDFSAE
jgi:hypothetical protein